jgi:hypothetical protein
MTTESGDSEIAMTRQVLPPSVRERLIATLESAPVIRKRLLETLAVDSTLWDYRPDPRRFTLREILAHLADCDDVWLERLVRTRDDDQPAFAGFDADAMATQMDYAHSDPWHSLNRLQESRRNISCLLRSLPDADWERVGINALLGPMSIEIQAVQIACHDGYHAGQIVELLGLAKQAIQQESWPVPGAVSAGSKSL